MSDKNRTIKQICQCEHCGNEAEMNITCSWEDFERAEKQRAEAPEKGGGLHQVKGSAICSHCGNEADMWIDI